MKDEGRKEGATERRNEEERRKINKRKNEKK